MSFRYKSFQISEIVKSAKAIREGQSLTFRSYGEKSKVLDVDLDLKEGALVDLRLRVSAGRFDELDHLRSGVDSGGLARARNRLFRHPADALLQGADSEGLA